MPSTCFLVFAKLKIATRSYHPPNSNDGVERVNHTMPDMLAMVVNELHKNWNEHLSHVDFAYNNSVSTAAGFAPNEAHVGRLCASLSRFSNAPGSSATTACPATTSPTATWRPTASSARTISSVNTMPSQLLAWNAATQPSPTHCVQFPKSTLVAGCERSIRLPPSVKAPTQTRTPRSSRPSSRLTGRAPTKSSQLALSLIHI